MYKTFLLILFNGIENYYMSSTNNFLFLPHLKITFTNNECHFVFNKLWKKIGYYFKSKNHNFFSILVKLRHFSGFKLIWHNIQIKISNVVWTECRLKCNQKQGVQTFNKNHKHKILQNHGEPRRTTRNHAEPHGTKWNHAVPPCKISQNNSWEHIETF